SENYRQDRQQIGDPFVPGDRSGLAVSLACGLTSRFREYSISCEGQMNIRTLVLAQRRLAGVWSIVLSLAVFAVASASAAGADEPKSEKRSPAGTSQSEAA